MSRRAPGVTQRVTITLRLRVRIKIMVRIGVKVRRVWVSRNTVLVTSTAVDIRITPWGKVHSRPMRDSRVRVRVRLTFRMRVIGLDLELEGLGLCGVSGVGNVGCDRWTKASTPAASPSAWELPKAI
eukprot:1332421-Amorphochlora_amoeboformis.AAC.1